jgi:fructan beta-fructosidase
MDTNMIFINMPLRSFFIVVLMLMLSANILAQSKRFSFKNLINSSAIKPTMKTGESSSKKTDKLYRPAIHFTPKAGWMNDPNGMIYVNGVYHLYYQHNPKASVWGPMHWGHATSKDLIHWKHQKIALYPNTLGTIFSGSAVIDSNNTSGFGKGRRAPLVAIYTQHSMEGEKAGRDDFQNQSISISLNAGKTFRTYKGNPVIKTPNLRDFRDPKVFWYEPTSKWIMSLAVGDHIEFYSSPNLRDWTKESDIGGPSMGVHDGNWECPDLVSFDVNGKKHWVLIVNVNPGAPAKGSGTQYFVGSFDGHFFKPYDRKEKWMDYGADNYAGVTWNNTGDKKILAGWMSNWLYAQVVPTQKWRSGLTIPRELTLIKRADSTKEDYLLSSKPIERVEKLEKWWGSEHEKNKSLSKPYTINKKHGIAPARLKLTMDTTNSFEIILSNNKGERFVIGYNAATKQYFMDRTKSGITSFHPDFAAMHTAPRFSSEKNIQLDLIIDNASVELFADNGLTVMTELFFNTKPFSKIEIASPKKQHSIIRQLSFHFLKEIF